MLNKKINLFMCGLVLASFCGCSNGKKAAVISNNPALAGLPLQETTVTIPKVPSNGCRLDVPMQMEAVANRPANFAVKLSYWGKKTLTIQEWMNEDAYNFEISYRRLEDNGYVKPDVEFVKFRRERVKNPARNGLTLNYSNQFIFILPLPFTEALKPGEKALYEVYVSTALHTFKLKSSRMLVVVQ